MCSLTSDKIGATSNLALKAILGIYAMGKINQALEVRGADPAKTIHYLVSCLQYMRLVCEPIELNNITEHS